MRRSVALLSFALAFGCQLAFAQTAPLSWKTSWVGAVQGPYPIGNPSAQPDQRFIFPAPAAGAKDQTFRLIVRPSIWGRQMRVRLSNAFGTKPIAFDDVHVGLQLGAAAIVTGTNRAVRFNGKANVAVEPSASVWSDAVDLPFADNPDSPLLQGRKLAVSF